MRVIGIDFGSTKIGVAVGETGHRVAGARQNLTPTGTLSKDAALIAELAEGEEAELVVLGLPLLYGAETKMSRIVRMLGERLQGHGVSVRYVDESLTSVEAESVMRGAGLKQSKRKRKVDGEAAARILERYFDEAS